MERDQYHHTEKLHQSEKRFARIGLRRLIEELYPTCQGNHVADFITQMASDLEISLERHPLGVQTSEADEKSFLGVRGSSIKRLVLGTPPGFRQVAEYFQKINLFEIKDYDPLTQKVVEHLATGPDDLDMIFRPRAGLNARDIFQEVIKSLKAQGFYRVKEESDEITLNRIGRRVKHPYDDYDVVVKYFEIGDPNTLPPVQGIKISFSYLEKHVLDVDLIKGPKDEELYNNFRLIGCMAAFDLFSFGHIHKTEDGKMLVDYETVLADSLDRPNLVRLYYQDDPDTFLNSFNARLRVVYQRTLWFNNFKDQAQAHFGNYQLKDILSQFVQGWLDEHPITKEKWLEYLCKQEQFNKLQARLSDIVSGFLVGMTYDPFLFLKLAFEAKLLSFLPISEFVRTRGDLDEIIGLMAKNYGSIEVGQFTYRSYQDLYGINPIDTLSQLSREYQTHILDRQPNPGDIKYTGSFIFLRALNKLLEERGQAPLQESLDTIVSLFNPMVFYLQNTGQGIPVDLTNQQSHEEELVPLSQPDQQAT